jgi:hypothetical protein
VTLHSFLSSSLHAGEWPATRPRLLYHLGKTRGRLSLKCDGTRAETIFHLSAKRTSPFKSPGASVQSTTGSREVRISGNNAGYTMFRGSVKSTGYPLHSPVSPVTFPPVRHRVPSHCNWTLHIKRRHSQVFKKQGGFVDRICLAGDVSGSELLRIRYRIFGV